MIQLIGAGCFGAIIGWFVYYINRYRKGDVQFSDLTTVLGIIGGAGITQLFGGGSADLFGAYGIGLAIGFFGYFFLLLLLVKNSANFDSDWFLDGRRKTPESPYFIPGDLRPSGPPMDVPTSSAPSTPTVVVNVAPSDLTHADYDATDKASEIIAQCETVWDANKSDCNAFVKEVCSHYQVSLTGQADNIVDQIQGPGWTKLSDGVAAKRAADQGQLVVCGLKGESLTPPEGNGHVAVVVSGGLAHGKYPTAYWGKLNGVGRKNTTLNYSFKKVDRDKVIYGARTV
ncbi:MAG: hypothetical protein AB2758_17720 [Candidatus Thiodiazotropha endolucinida]